MSTNLRRVALGCVSTAALVLALAPCASAATTAVAATGATATAGADQSPGSTTSAGAEGATVDTVIVTAERQVGARAAPTKASLDQTQPESIISHDFIDSVTPDVGNISTVVFIAPSISGISGNAGGIGNYFSTTMRGFADGFYNVTYDGIAFGDTNNPTHHPNDYFPVSEIGAAVVDRGPGAAGDLGQANYGGAIHYFSPTISDVPSALQKITYGSFNTLDSVTTLQSGDISQLGGTKFWVDFDERSSDTELSDSGGYALNQSIKFATPALLGGKFTLTGFVTHAWSRYNFPDGEGPGEDLAQINTYGKNFQLDNIPGDEHYVGYNFERKQTWFTYLDAKYQVNDQLAFEDQPYYYSYSNKTTAANATSDLIGVNTADNVKKPLTSPTDVLGYLKQNDYQVFGDVFRGSYQLPFGVLKFGALVEGSVTYRQKAFYDFNTGQPDLEFTPAKDPLLKTASNYQLREFSNWHQEQGFVDFNWTPLPNLTISPGFKYVNFVREVNATNEKFNVDTDVGGVITTGSTVGPLHAKNDYTSPLYFLTANYKLTSYFSAYAQYATSFVIPQLSELYSTAAALQDLKPETTINYQTGVVYSRGPVTWDADFYMINARNTNVPCNIPDPNGGFDAASCDAGTVHYSGFEGQGAYLLPFGLTVFVNGSINNARDIGSKASPSFGCAFGSATAGQCPAMPTPATPDYTAAAGVIYRSGPWQASVTFKQVGNSFVTGGAQTAANNFTGEIKLPVYNTVNGDIAYSFLRRYQVKLQIFNLLDRRAVINYVPQGNETTLWNSAATTSYYTFQSGREIDGTLSVKF